jgi:hypothetical protein
MVSHSNQESTGQQNSPGDHLSFLPVYDDERNDYLEMLSVNLKLFLKGCLNNCLEITEDQLQRGIISGIEFCSVDGPSYSIIEAMGIC